MSRAWVNVNGEISPGSEARVSVFDRGFLYGDSLYEVVRSYRGKFYMIDEHLTRLERSAELCRMILGQPRDVYRREILRTYEAFRASAGTGESEAYCRLIVSRGVGRIGFGLDCLETPTQYVIIVQPVDPPTEAQFNRGMKLRISDRLRNDRRALDPAMKSGNYLNSLLAYLEASAGGFDDALLCNEEGHLTEGTTFNIFYVRRGRIATPPLEIGILDGITRRKVLEAARRLGVETREVRFPRARLLEADEVFISSSIREVFPVTLCEEKSFSVGPVTRQLAAAYRAGI